MKELRNILIETLLCLAAATVFAQTTYTVGASTCNGQAPATWLSCYSLPLTIGTTTTTAWIEMDYPPNTAEEFLVFHDGNGSYQTSAVTLVSTTNVCWVSNGRNYCSTLPAEITANLTGDEGTTGSGTLDIKLTYPIGATGRYTRGPIATTTGGTITISQ